MSALMLPCNMCCTKMVAFFYLYYSRSYKKKKGWSASVLKLYISMKEKGILYLASGKKSI